VTVLLFSYMSYLTEIFSNGENNLAGCGAGKSISKAEILPKILQSALLTDGMSTFEKTQLALVDVEWTCKNG